MPEISLIPTGIVATSHLINRILSVLLCNIVYLMSDSCNPIGSIEATKSDFNYGLSAIPIQEYL